MAKIAIVYHSGYGHTAVQAEAVRRGASEVDWTDVALIPVEEYEQNWDVIDVAHQLISAAHRRNSKRSSMQRPPDGSKAAGRTNLPQASPTRLA